MITKEEAMEKLINIIENSTPNEEYRIMSDLIPLRSFIYDAGMAYEKQARKNKGENE